MKLNITSVIKLGLKKIVNALNTRDIADAIRPNDGPSKMYRVIDSYRDKQSAKMENIAVHERLITLAPRLYSSNDKWSEGGAKELWQSVTKLIRQESDFSDTLRMTEILVQRYLWHWHWPELVIKSPRQSFQTKRRKISILKIDVNFRRFMTTSEV